MAKIKQVVGIGLIMASPLFHTVSPCRDEKHECKDMPNENSSVVVMPKGTPVSTTLSSWAIRNLSE